MTKTSQALKPCPLCGGPLTIHTAIIPNGKMEQAEGNTVTISLPPDKEPFYLRPIAVCENRDCVFQTRPAENEKDLIERCNRRS